MSTEKKSRLSIDCSLQERTKIKILAAALNQTITDFVLEAVREKNSFKRNLEGV